MLQLQPQPKIKDGTPRHLMKKTVLVVEDSRTDRLLIASLLQNAGLNVPLADSVTAAERWLADNGVPDAIVLDIVMPDDTGLELCRRLRADPLTASVPILFCSSKDQEFDQFWALRQGGNAYITKPFDPNELVTKVQKYLGV